MGAIASQITSLTSVYSTVYSDVDQRKHQSSASLAFVWGFHRGPVNSPHKWPVARKMFPFDDVIMKGGKWSIHGNPQRQPVTWPQSLLQNIIVGNVNIIQGSSMATNSVQYSQTRSKTNTSVGSVIAITLTIKHWIPVIFIWKLKQCNETSSNRTTPICKTVLSTAMGSSNSLSNIPIYLLIWFRLRYTWTLSTEVSALTPQPVFDRTDNIPSIKVDKLPSSIDWSETVHDQSIYTIDWIYAIFMQAKSDYITARNEWIFQEFALRWKTVLKWALDHFPTTAPFTKRG